MQLLRQRKLETILETIQKKKKDKGEYQGGKIEEWDKKDKMEYMRDTMGEL